MALIYRNAQQVFIWLGSHKQPVDKNHEQKLGNAKNFDKGARHAAEIKLEYFLHSLIQEEYWKRAWIIQEVGVASNHGVQRIRIKGLERFHELVPRTKSK